MRTWGHGPERVLFLHGFTGSARSFDHLEPLLGDAITATCVDLPGHRSSPAAETFDEVIERLLPLLDRPTSIIGYSQGARVGLALALRSPASVNRLILESASPGLRQRRARALRRLEDLALARSIVEAGVPAFLDRWETTPLLSGLRQLDARARRELRRRREEHTAEGLASALRCMGQGAQPDLGPLLPSLHAPTLVLCGALDAKYSALAATVARELPLAWRVCFEGAGHTPHLECPREYAREVRAFLATSWNHEAHLAAESGREA